MTNVPGCFGLVLPHSTIKTCKACPCLVECRNAGKATLMELGTMVDVADLEKHYADLLEKPSTGDLRWKYETMLAGMAVKPRKFAVGMLRKGIDLPRSLQAGENPFRTRRPAFLRIACEALLQGGFRKRELKARYMQEIHAVRERTADSYLSIAFALLRDFDIIEEAQAGFYQIRREG